MSEVPTDTTRFGEPRLQLLRYLERSKLRFSEVPLEPDWHLAPHVFVWRVFGFNSDVEPSWFAISGNLPTDYVTTHHADDARGAMRHFARLWLEAADCMKAGTAHQSFTIGTPEKWPEIHPWLRERAVRLAEFAEDDTLWT